MRYLVVKETIETRTSIVDFKKVRLGGYSIFYNMEKNDNNPFFKKYICDDSISFIQGYLFDENGIDYFSKNKIIVDFPFSENFFGSFTIMNLSKDNLVIVNDVVGTTPIYYYETEDQIHAISTDLPLIKQFFDLEIDEVCILQRLIGPERSELGSRTLLKGVKRLLPGEGRFYSFGKFSVSKFDNTLFSKVKNLNISPENLALELNSLVQKISTKCNSIDIALSSGFDSRLNVVFLENYKEKIKNVFTLGTEKMIEVRLAKKISKILNVEHKTFWSYLDTIPNNGFLKTYHYPNFSCTVPLWLPMLKHGVVFRSDLTFFGDMCESINGRNIYGGSRAERIKRFFSFKNNDINLEENDLLTNQFNILSSNSRLAIKRHSDLFTLNSDFLLNEIKNDFNEIKNRIQMHNGISEFEKYELFKWYTHGRHPMGKQLNIFHKSSFGFSPSMDMRILKFVSSISQNERIDYKYLFKFIKVNFNENRLFKIPTSQSAFFSPNLLGRNFYLVSWGIRSILDRFGLKFFSKRIVDTINWKDCYNLNNESIRELTREFESQSLGLEFNKILINRKSGVFWPLAPFDILNLKTLDFEIQLLRTIKKITD